MGDAEVQLWQDTRVFVRQAEPGHSTCFHPHLGGWQVQHHTCHPLTLPTAGEAGGEAGRFSAGRPDFRSAPYSYVSKHPQSCSLPTFPPLQSGATKRSLIGLCEGWISRHKTRGTMIDTWETPIKDWQILLLSSSGFLPPLLLSLGLFILALLVSGLYLSFSF